jgi:hypothetical protein
MYTDKYSKFENEEELLKGKDSEFKLFYYYVKKIHIRCKKEGCSHGRVLWEDFPYDLYDDAENWINRNNMNDVKKYIDYIKERHEHTKESARLFWQHWLSYKNINKNRKII